ncbi:MAG: hypothetical protein V1765_03165 [bacterium]
MDTAPLAEKVFNSYLNIAEGKPTINNVFWLYFVYIISTAVISLIATAGCPGPGQYGVLILTAVIVRTRHTKLLTISVGLTAITVIIGVTLFYARPHYMPKEWLVLASWQFYRSPIFWLSYTMSLLLVYSLSLFLDKHLSIGVLKQHT